MSHLSDGEEQLTKLGYTNQTLHHNENGTTTLIALCEVQDEATLLVKMHFSSQGVLTHVETGELQADGTEQINGEAARTTNIPLTTIPLEPRTVVLGYENLKKLGYTTLTQGTLPNGTLTLTGRKNTQDNGVSALTLYYTPERHNYKTVEVVTTQDGETTTTTQNYALPMQQRN